MERLHPNILSFNRCPVPKVRITCRKFKTKNPEILTHSLTIFNQAFVVAGGNDGTDNLFSSVFTLIPGATSWTTLASLPRALWQTKASIVGGMLRLIGGFDGNVFRSEVFAVNKLSDRECNTVLRPQRLNLQNLPPLVC